MWPFKSRSQPENLSAQVRERVREHENRLTDLELDAANLLKRLQKLEGTIYSRRATTPEAESEKLSKAQLRLKLGIVPGQVPPNLRK